MHHPDHTPPRDAIERQMLLNILHFGEKNAGDVAVPRGDIEAVPVDGSSSAGRTMMT